MLRHFKAKFDLHFNARKSIFSCPCHALHTRVVGQEVKLTAERMLDMQSPVGERERQIGKLGDWERGAEGQREKERGRQTEPECAASVCVGVCLYVWI